MVTIETSYRLPATPQTEVAGRTLTRKQRADSIQRKIGKCEKLHNRAGELAVTGPRDT